MSLEIYCDFDGTITKKDTVDFLLEELADPAWKEIEARWESGEIGSRECMAKQVALIKGGWKAIERALSRVEFDPTFVDFAYWCRAEGIPLRIVSDGIDRVVHYLLSRERIQVSSIVANRLVEFEGGKLGLEFPYEARNNHCSSGVCKCQVLSGVRAFGSQYIKIRTGHTNVVIGDGKSDICWAPVADCLFAKSKLLKYCSANNIPYIRYDNFNNIRAVLEEQFVPVKMPTFVQPSFQPVTA
jgi:2,3-diketo-5-methylthio-1-phosphopentane phosphatase